MEGWIKLHRKIQGNGLWEDKPFSRGQAWVDLLISASHKECSYWVRGIEVNVKEGQVSMSTLTMADRWGWSRGKVRNFLEYLETSQRISQQKNNVTTLISIVKWNQYQIEKPADKPPESHIQECKEVILYLNEVTGKSYKATAKGNRDNISGRLNDGYTVGDCKTVIDKKWAEWRGTDYEEYVRPTTLFAPTKFDSYLNQGKKDKKQTSNKRHGYLG